MITGGGGSSSSRRRRYRRWWIYDWWKGLCGKEIGVVK